LPIPSRIAIALALIALPVMTLTAANVASVVQKGRTFSVPSLRIGRGDLVRFNNDDLFLHQVYVETPEFNFESDEQEPGTSVDIQFSRAGLLEVRCHIHPKMLLQVDVR